MTDPFVAEIRIFGFTFPPKGWAHCDGALMPISQNTALFSLLGTMYGGDGKSTFALPDMQSRVAVSQGQGPTLSDYQVGEEVGVTTVALQQSEMPNHRHAPQAVTDPAEQSAPAPDRAFARATPGQPYQSNATANLVPLAPEATSVVGTGTPHNNLQPVLTTNFCIALQGVFPQRP
jgi:microcystin-dependent protein